MDCGMQTFLLNFTRILEKNPRIYICLIAGIVISLMLFVAEAIHIQNMIESLQTKDQNLMREAVEPIASRYRWTRVLVLFVMLIWSIMEFKKTKKLLGL